MPAGLSFEAGDPGHSLASVAGSMYSQETVDYYQLGRSGPWEPGGDQQPVDRAERAWITRIQVVGATVGLDAG